MNSSKTRILAIGVYLIVFCFLINNPTLFAQQKKTNIVLIMADDLGFECINTNGGT